MSHIRMGGIALFTLFAPTLAVAGPVLDARIDGAVSGADAPQLGTGLGARVGFPIDVGPIEVIPEAGATFWMGDGLLAPDLGARARRGAAVRPGAYAHVLFPLPTPGGPTRGWDAGGSLDVTFLPVELGVHAGAVTFDGQGVPSRTAFVGGLRVGLTF
jgi:hypothetical protein